jgi:hypothetical protein
MLLNHFPMSGRCTSACVLIAGESETRFTSVIWPSVDPLQKSTVTLETSFVTVVVLGGDIGETGYSEEAQAIADDRHHHTAGNVTFESDLKRFAHECRRHTERHRLYQAHEAAGLVHVRRV